MNFYFLISVPILIQPFSRIFSKIS